MHFTEYDTRLAAYAVIVNEAGELLLTWYNGEGTTATPKWTLPGGGIEHDEAVEDGLVREVYEETGYDVTVGALLATSHFTVENFRGRGRLARFQRLLYSATVTGGELGTTEVGGSTDFAQWVPIAEIPHTSEHRSDIIEIALEILAARA